MREMILKRTLRASMLVTGLFPLTTNRSPLTAQGRPLAIEDYYRLKTIGGVAISPDGKRLVVDQPHGSVVVRLDLPSADPVELPGVFGTWSPASTHLAFDTRGGLAVVDADDGLSEVIAPRLHFRHAAWSPDGKSVALVLDSTDLQEIVTQARPELYVMQVASGQLRRVPTGFVTSNWRRSS